MSSSTFDFQLHPDHYMTQDQLIYFQQKLLSLKEKIIQSFKNLQSELKRNSDPSADLFDSATTQIEVSQDLKHIERNRSLLHKIDYALNRIQSGEYGYCEETGDEIGLKRLEVQPFATLSIDAQERQEKMDFSPRQNQQFPLWD